MRNIGGRVVGKGTYWNMATGSSVEIETEGTLPGDPSTRYVKVNRFAMMVLGPILGLLYVICMPLLALATITALIGGKAVEGLLALVGKSVSFGWRPANSYLSGKKKAEKQKSKDGK